jgi:hypothetical protein
MEPVQMLVPVGKCPWLVDDVQLFFAAATISKNFFGGDLLGDLTLSLVSLQQQHRVV